MTKRRWATSSLGRRTRVWVGWPVGMGADRTESKCPAMESELLYQNEGPPMGGGTVGLLIDDVLFVGSFSGDRIL